MELIPLYDQVLIEKIKEDETTDGGLIISILANDILKGKIYATGQGSANDTNELRPLIAKVGDTVLYRSNMAEVVKYRDLELVTIRETGIIAIIKGE